MHSGDEWQHTTVLLAEAIESLLTTPDGVYVDGTFGRGGHSRALLAKLSPRGRLIAFDRDPEAVAAARSTIADARFAIEHAPFSELKQRLAARGVLSIDGLLLDLGVSSPQIDNPARGFSFRHDAPLDMRMDPTRGESAADFLARADERQIAEVIRDHGEERFAVPIAKALVARRESGNPVRTTGELSQVVARAVKTREPGQDPATRTFQALRIFINAELEELQQALESNQHAVQHRPDLGFAWNNMAGLLLQQHRYAEALQASERAAELQPADASTLSQLATGYAFLGRFDEAEATFALALALPGKQDDTRLNRAWMHGMRGAWKQALADYESLPDQRQPRVRRAMSLALLHLNDPQRARDLAEQAIAAADTVPIDWGILAVAEQRLGRADAAAAAADADYLAAVVMTLEAMARSVLYVGRNERTVSARLRRALEIRDGHCAFPGCRARLARCHAHHVTHWQHGGTTDLPNMVLLCPSHHVAVHEGGWTLALKAGATGHERGCWLFTPPTLRSRRARP